MKTIKVNTAILATIILFFVACILIVVKANVINLM